MSGFSGREHFMTKDKDNKPNDDVIILAFMMI